ncbi:25681_t:CDS:2, partial [Gigaspora margarita]
YLALGGPLEAVDKYGIEDWIAKCIQYMVNETIDEKQLIFIEMAQSVTKVLDKIEHNVTTMSFLEHIFGYAHRLIEDFTLLDFLMMNEKIIKNINIEMKGSIKHPDSIDGYNICLGSIKDSLDPEVALFSTEFEIGSTLEKKHEINSTSSRLFQSFTIDIPDGALNIETALRFERMNSAEKSTLRTKAGNFHFYICNEKIYVAEILAVFKKYGTSYRRAESLDGLNTNHIHAILYEQDILNQYEFFHIVDSLKFNMRSLGKVEVKSKTTSFFLGRYVTLSAIQLQLYKKSMEEISRVESGVMDAEALMKNNLE